MDKEQICRSLQNIINIKHVWEFHKFDQAHLIDIIKEEMTDVAATCEKKEEALQEMENILSTHASTINDLEKENFHFDSYQMFMEALKKWKRHYLVP